MDEHAPKAWGTLWIVATPIGTLGDFSARAGAVLESVDLLLAEDTRRTRKLLTALDLRIGGQLRSLHEHNEERIGPVALGLLQEGRDVALVSDAGTPVLSDPGFELVRSVRELGGSVSTVPGPSAFVAALAASGQPPLPAVLVGFLPPKTGRRRRRLEEPIFRMATTVVLCSPHRLAAELRDAAEVLGAGRPATLVAELSKRHERADFGTLGSLADGAEAQKARGEYVLVIGPPQADEPPVDGVTPAVAQETFQSALDEVGERRAALKQAARNLGLSRKELYALLLENEEF